MNSRFRSVRLLAAAAVLCAAVVFRQYPPVRN